MKNKNLLYSVIGIALVLAVAVPIAYSILGAEPPLPVYNPADINPKLVDESLQGKTHSHRVGHFNLTNQAGQTVTQAG